MERLEEALSKEKINYEAEGMEKPQGLTEQQDTSPDIIPDKDKSIKKLKSKSRLIQHQFSQERKVDLFKSGSKSKEAILENKLESSAPASDLANSSENLLFSKDGSSMNILEPHETFSHAKSKLKLLNDKGLKSKSKIKEAPIITNHPKKSADVLFEGLVEQFTPSNGLSMEKRNLILQKCAGDPDKLEIMLMEEGSQNPTWSTFLLKNSSKLSEAQEALIVTIQNQQNEEHNLKSQKLQIKFDDSVVANRLRQALNLFLSPKTETSSKGKEQTIEVQHEVVAGETSEKQSKVQDAIEVPAEVVNDSLSKDGAVGQQDVIPGRPSSEVSGIAQSSDPIAAVESTE